MSERPVPLGQENNLDLIGEALYLEALRAVRAEIDRLIGEATQ